MARYKNAEKNELPVNENELPVNENELPANENEMPVNENENEMPANEEVVADPEPAAEVPQVDLAKAPLADGIRDAQVNNLQLSEEALKTKLKLAKEEKIHFMIPFDPGESKGSYRPVIINGYRFEVKKGMMVQMPMTVAKLLMRSMDVEVSALTDHENNLNFADGEKRRALDI